MVTYENIQVIPIILLSMQTNRTSKNSKELIIIQQQWNA
jgi:hypothetical protein